MKTFDVYHKLFIERLKDCIGEKSILAFAEDKGIHPRMLSHWVKGEQVPGMENLIILAQKLNISLDYLVGLTND